MNEPTTPSTQTTQSQNTAEQPTFAAMSRLRERLVQAGLDQETIAVILGRYVSKVSDKVLSEVLETLSDVITTPEVGGLVDDAARQAKIESLFKERTGKTIIERREEVADEMVKEFEALRSK